MTTPDLATSPALARDRRVIPVTRRLLADGETPVHDVAFYTLNVIPRSAR